MQDAVEFDLVTRKLGQYTPRDSDSKDRHHFNSLLSVGGRMYVAAHNAGHPSFISTYDALTFQPGESLGAVGKSIHGLAYDRGELFGLSSADRELRSNRGLRLTIANKGFPRGFAVTRDLFIVGVSEIRNRGERMRGDSWLYIICRHSNSVLHTIQLPDTGGINDLRLLDAFDFAHARPPLWKRGEAGACARERISA